MADGAEDEAADRRRRRVRVVADKNNSVKRDALPVMSRQPPRHQASAASGASKGSAPSVTSNHGKKGKEQVVTPTTPVSLDPIHRQKIQELRLKAAKATLKRQRSLRRKSSSYF